MSRAPFFVEPHTQESEGVDYLGLRALNLSMMDALLPGLNNVVSMIRPFTLMSWVAWRFEETVAGRPTVSSKEFEVFKQKVETVYVMSQVQAGHDAGLPGRQQKVPTTDMIRFQFSAFQRQGSILDAALYGPAIKSLSGLGFLSASDNGVFLKPTPFGRELALALDGRLREHLTKEQYEFISSLNAIDAPGNLIDEQFDRAWSLAEVSVQEKETFKKRLFQPELIGQRNPHARRAAVLLYAIESLRAVESPVNEAQLRSVMAYRFPPTLLAHPHAQTFRQVQRHWQLLQVRQAQRLAMESLFGWVERSLQHTRAASVEDLVNLALPTLKLQAESPMDKVYLHQQMTWLRGAGADLDELFAAGQQDPEALDVMTLCDKLETAVKNKGPAPDVVPLAIRLLLLSARYAEAFRDDEITTQEVSAGARFRLPLGVWAEFLGSHESHPFSALLHKVLGSFIVSQHLGVAAARSGDEKSRMRLSIEDRGLTSVLSNSKRVLVPRRTADRLGSALALMSACGLTQQVSASGVQQATFSAA